MWDIIVPAALLLGIGTLWTLLVVRAVRGGG